MVCDFPKLNSTQKILLISLIRVSSILIYVFSLIKGDGVGPIIFFKVENIVLEEGKGYMHIHLRIF